MTLSVDFSRRLAQSQFQSRITDIDGDQLAYRLADRSGHIQIARSEWKEVGQYFRDRTRSSAIQAYIGLILSTPAFVLFIIMSHYPPLSWFFSLFSRNTAGLIAIVPLPGIPVAVYLRHSYHVRRVVKTIERELSSRARIAAPPRDPRKIPLWLDILAMLFVGPGLVLAMLGETNPALLENTPLSGAHIGLTFLAGTFILCLRIMWPRLATLR